MTQQAAQANAVVRSRVPRRLDVDDVAEPTTVDQANALIEKVTRANKAKNAQTKIERDALKELNALMAQHGLEVVKHRVDGVLQEAKIASGETTVIDVRDLFDKVEIDQFLRMVSATQGAVTAEVGSNVLASVSKTKPTEKKLTVKKYKEN